MRAIPQQDETPRVIKRGVCSEITGRTAAKYCLGKISSPKRMQKETCQKYLHADSIPFVDSAIVEAIYGTLRLEQLTYRWRFRNLEMFTLQAQHETNLSCVIELFN